MTKNKKLYMVDATNPPLLDRCLVHPNNYR